jgi:hypothetical protein
VFGLVVRHVLHVVSVDEVPGERVVGMDLLASDIALAVAVEVRGNPTVGPHERERHAENEVTPTRSEEIEEVHGEPAHVREPRSVCTTP